MKDNYRSDDTFLCVFCARQVQPLSYCLDTPSVLICLIGSLNLHIYNFERSVCFLGLTKSTQYLFRPCCRALSSSVNTPTPPCPPSPPHLPDGAANLIEVCADLRYPSNP
uniref:Uncharacterized protein n=1 Tax=Steinernema glaseri TaxID=37863 RepID=A0A1I8ABM1_9BILA